LKIDGDLFFYVFVSAAKAGMPGSIRRKALGDITNSRSGEGSKEGSRKNIGAGGKQQLKYIQPLAAPATLVTFPYSPTS
jgi:hypothetical protein